jgi:isopropylmalate/homocitrate/citramalate synthase
MRLTITDVGPRDGLQNESRVLPPETRAELCRQLAAAGLPKVEAASFVNPRLVPQMAGANDVVAAVHGTEGCVMAGLVLNERGFERAQEAGVDEVHYAFPVTDSFARRNQNSSVEAGILASHAIVRRAREANLPVTVTLSVSFGCPFEGAVPDDRVMRVSERVLEVPPDELVLADTIGVGVPSQVTRLVRGVRELRDQRVGCHFHNTRNTGYANALAALEAGVESLDASVGGTGGCPFAPRATGNIATEDLAYMLEGMGVDTGIDLGRLLGVSEWLGAQLGKELPGQLARAGMFPAA